MALTIAIDGFSSCGKSTLARELAKTLDYVFIDTGAMYRAITLDFIRHNVATENHDCVLTRLQGIKLNFEPNGNDNIIFLNGENVEKEIRESEVSNKVSEVAKIKAVRNFSVQQQREWGKNGGVVMDGRDIGTVVFPNADLKIFMTADRAIREDRRYQELRANNPNITKDEVSKNLKKRDRLDTERKESPLVQAKDAKILDNSHLNKTEQLNIALEWVAKIKKSNG